MPRPAKAPRLYLRKKADRAPQWVIVDREAEHPTGCAAGDSEGAEKALAKYLAAKHVPNYSDGEPGRVSITDVLILFLTKHAPTLKREDTAKKAAVHLSGFFEHNKVGDLTPGLCRDYTKWRQKQ